MTGPDPLPAKKPLWRRFMRRLLWASIVPLVLVCTLLGGLYWSLGSESGSQALIAALSRWSGGMLQIEGWQGYVAGQFKAERLRLHLAAMDIDAERVAFDWRPRALRRGLLSIENLHVGRLEIRQTPSGDPLRMPTSLSLPFPLHVAAFDVSVLAIGKRAAKGATLPPPDLLLHDLTGSVDSDAHAHRIHRLALKLPAGNVTAKGDIQLKTPYELNAQAAFVGKLAERAVNVEARATGSLNKLALTLQAKGQGMSGTADVRVRPFAALPVELAHIALKGVDPALFHPEAPHALLDVLANLTPRLPVASGQGASAPDPLQWQVSGPVEVLNRKPATIDAGGVPVERLSSNLSWAEGALQLEGLQILLPGRGRIAGKLKWQTLATDAIGRIETELSVQGLDPARLHSRLRPMQIAGKLSGKSAPGVGKNASQVQAFRIDLASGDFRLTAQGGQRDGVLELQQAALTAGKASVEASGRYQWQVQPGAQDTQAFSAKGRMLAFDPRAFVPSAPQGNLNAEFSLDGALKPTWRAHMALAIASSTLAAYPLQGRANLVAEPGRVHDADVALDLLGNQLKLSGAVGHADDRLQILVDAAQLGRLQSGLRGTLTAQGSVGGSLQEPFIALTAQARGLGLADTASVESVQAKLQLESGARGALDGNIDLKGVRTGGDKTEPLLRNANVAISGRRDEHTVRMNAALIKNQSLSVTAEGGLRATPATTGAVATNAWQGRLTQLLAQGPLALRLKSPAEISIAPQRVALGEAQLEADNGNVQLTTTEWTPLRSVARGRMTGLQIGFAVDEFQHTVMRGKSLQLGAEWDVTLAERANGLIRVFREGGDFILHGDAPVALGLETLELNLAAQEDRLALSALANGKRIGAINFAGTALARRQGSQISLDPDAVLTGVGHVDIPALDWLGPAIDQNLRTGGSIVGDFNILGTAARPQSSGHIVGSKLTLGLADQGLRLRDGNLELNFDAARATLSKLDFRAERSMQAPDPRLRVLHLPGADAGKDESGRLSGSGGIDLKTGQGKFELTADHVPALQGANQWMLVSGTATIDSGWNSMDLKAKLRADAGFIGVPKSGAPTLGNDVQVRGQQPKPPQRMRLNVDVDFDFGRNFIVKAWGIDTWLDGQLRVQLAQGQQPRATGALRARDGVFEAYGQTLTIDRGLINFAGPLDNPALNVVAVRKGLAVEAGVEVTGLVRQPRARLVSDPEVPESEKLSWILLGRSSDVQGGDAGLLIAAASAAFSGDGPPITSRVANTFGFDDISLGQGGTSSRPVQSRVASNSTGSSGSTTGSVNEQVVSFGKHLSAKAYLALEQNLEGTESIVKITYKLTRYLSLIAGGGTDNSLDLHYDISFK
ncbi:translocation/assembly module TamB domain-containing protein [Uliginosibacterium sp. H3]|uniref:Translocation/assembly module TamB domain-containing protein n=1 Tax=Uliginosibacterium silvisoli TaxID=3114758 RepID=A0ABU6K4X4_9RHOO|nr:translocation/assembly module TamB domain-containing protein [Uliginosibacterium sp. H3]